MGLPIYHIPDPPPHTWSREQLQALQSERLRRMVKYVYDHAPFWRRKFKSVGLLPEDIRGVEDLSNVPFCTRQELEADQREHPPFGSYVCTGPREWIRFFTTSGTSGSPLRRVVSRRDWNFIVQRVMHSGWLRPDDVLMLLAPTDAVMGPNMTTDGADRLGALVIHAGRWNTRAKIEMIHRLRPTIVAGTPSYLLYLSDLATEMGIDLRQCGLRALSVGGEPGGAIEATRSLLAERFGVERIIENYGMTEIFGMGSNCDYSPSIHIFEDAVIVECIDPETGKPVPPGELGELVFTNLIGDTQPVLRYRSRDMGRLSDGAPCACGSRFLRIEGSIQGRSDDMIWYRGVNFFPSSVEAVIREIEGLSPEYRIVIEGERSLPTLTVQVESLETQPSPDVTDRLAQEAQQRLQAVLKVRPKVDVLAKGSLPRSEGGKAKRVVDLRK